MAQQGRFRRAITCRRVPGRIRFGTADAMAVQGESEIRGLSLCVRVNCSSSEVTV
jgi:hypothetical protein